MVFGVPFKKFMNLMDFKRRQQNYFSLGFVEHFKILEYNLINLSFWDNFKGGFIKLQHDET